MKAIVFIIILSLCMSLSYALQPFNILSLRDFDAQGVGMYSQVRIPPQSNDLPIVSVYNASKYLHHYIFIIILILIFFF